jgi:hypothetical protein
MTMAAHRLWCGTVLLVVYAGVMALDAGRWSLALLIVGLFLVLVSFGEASR